MANSTRENPFRLHAVMESLRLNAPTKELGILRQISVNYNQFMSSTYFDKLKKRIVVQRIDDFGLSDPDEYIKKSITRETWDPVILGPLFRKLTVSSHDYVTPCARYLRERALGSSNLKILEVLPSCGPYITKLKFEMLDGSEYDPNDFVDGFLGDLSNIIGTLPNLKLFVFRMILFTGIRSVPTETENFTRLIKNVPNPLTTIVWELTPSFDKDGYNYFSTWIESIGSLPNPVFFDFNVDANFMDSVRIQEFTEFVLKHIKQVRKLQLSIQLTKEIFQSYPGYVKNCINVLRPWLTYIFILEDEDYNDESYEEFLTASLNFPNLNVLNLTSPRQNLEFLKSCPNLKKIFLGTNQNTWIFSDPGKSDKENIDSCFRHLKKLKLFVMWCKEDDKIQDGNELGNYLKSVLPINTHFELLQHGEGSTLR